MYANFKDKAIDFVKEAVAADEAGEYDKAFKSYMTALEYFKTHLKYEKNPRSKEAITLKVRKWAVPAWDFAWFDTVNVMLLHQHTTLKLWWCKEAKSVDWSPHGTERSYPDRLYIPLIRAPPSTQCGNNTNNTAVGAVRTHALASDQSGWAHRRS